MLMLSVQLAVAVAALSALLPLTFRVIRSPWTSIFVLPPLVVLSLVCGFLSSAVLGWYSERTGHRSRIRLSRFSRPLTFSTPAAWQAVLTRSKWSHKSPHSLRPLRPQFPLVSASVNDLLIIIVRDFVLVWYTQLSDSPSFPTAVSESLHGSLESVLDRVATLDLASLMVRRILPKLTAHVERFRYSETALRGAGLERHLTQSEELDLLLASRYAGKGGSLHTAVDNLSSTFTKQSEETHLRQLVETALPLILPSKDANSRAVRIVAREILACAVLGPIADMLGDPDFWNRTIDSLAGEAIRQQKLISKVRNVIESQSPARMRQDDLKMPQHESAITLRTDARQFEAFLRSINRYDSLLDIRRLKNDIVGEIRRTRALLAKHDNEDWIDGHKTEDVVAFLDRLYTAKRKVEKRIAVLGGLDDSHPSLAHDPDLPSRLSLRDVLTNPSSLSYFMEFMDRRGRSLVVQFWLTVESFKNPLEAVESGSSGDEKEPAEDAILASSASIATLKEDLTMVKDLYFSNPSIPSGLSAVSPKHVEAIRSYALHPDANLSQERKARRSILAAQRQIEEDMDHDFDEFKRSDLWFRVVSDLEPKALQDSGTLPLPMSPPALHQSHSSSSNFIASLVPGLVTDANRGLSSQRPVFGFRTEPSATAASVSAPALRRISQESARSFSGASALRTVSAQAPASNLDLLMSPSDETSAVSRAPLFDEADDGRLVSADADEAQRMEALQAAVTDIIATENRENTLSNRASSVEAASIQSQGGSDLHSTESRRRAMFDDVFEGDEDVGEHDNEYDGEPQTPFELPAPGDLQLSHEIARLGDKISHLQSQDLILDSLIRKAELTGDAQELKLLRKSKSALERELRQLNFQKMQYEQQESANKLVPGRTHAAIVNSTAGEEDGKQVVRYLIEVQQLASNGTFASGWVVARRYSEFLVMHQRLRERFLQVKNLDFPGKRLVTTLSSNVVDSRRIALEKYLQNILAIPLICESPELKAFLSRDSPFMSKAPSEPLSREATTSFPGHNLVRHVYRSLTESIDDMIFGPSMLDVMIGRLTRQAAEFAGIVGSGVNDEDLVTQALKASGKAPPEETLMQLPGDLKPLDGETSTSSFIAPICDLILAVFELDKKNNWLRRQAIVIILQQVLGGTIEKKFRDSLKSMLDEAHLLSFIGVLKDGLWPGGKLKQTDIPRTAEQKAKTRDEASRKLSALFPDVAANMMGRNNARRGARRIFAVLQNRRLNQHIVYTVLDEIFLALFPDAKATS